MSLQGNLTEFSLQEILHLIADRKKSGRLSVTQEGESVYLDFNKGKVTYVVPSFAKDPLIIRAEQEGLAPAGSFKKLGGDKLTEPEQREALMSRNLVKKEDLGGFIRLEAGHDLAEMMFWKAASFVFESAEARPEVPIELKLEEVLQEAITQSVRFKELRQLVPSEDTRVRLVPLNAADEMIALDAKQWQMVCCIAAGGDVAAIRREFNRDGFTFYETLGTIIEKGLAAGEDESVEELEDSEGLAPIRGRYITNLLDEAEQMSA